MLGYLLRRLLISVPYGRGTTNAWFSVYDAYRLRRLLHGFRPLSIRYYRRNGNRYERCTAEDIADAGTGYIFDVRV